MSYMDNDVPTFWFRGLGFRVKLPVTQISLQAVQKFKIVWG